MPEYVTLVDEHDNVIGSKDRDELTDDDRWRIITIWITNSKNQVLLAQRALTKRINPGKWGPAVAGTVEHGDSYEQTAERELTEEIGVKANLTPGKVLFYKSALGKRACKAFTATVDLPIEAITIPADEVAAVKWVDGQTLWEDVAAHPDDYLREFKRMKELFDL